MNNAKKPLRIRFWPGTIGHYLIGEYRAFRTLHPRLYKWTLILLLVLLPIVYELRTSAFSSRIISSYARRMSYKIGPGPSPNIIFPKHGPFDVRTGYALIPNFERRLSASGYKITEQTRFSPELVRAAQWGIRPPYLELMATKLTIHGEKGQPLFQAPVVGDYFNSFEEIPPLVVKSLLLIENRELDEPADYRTNPVVDWDRLAKAALLYAGHKLGLPLPVEGGSTLATQMEKYRHSYEGRTDSLMAKLRQMTDASLKVYQNGPDTREERRQIILDYLNSIPLSAAPGYGELHGIGNGVNAWFGLRLEDVEKSLMRPDKDSEKAKAFKHILSLLCSVKAPSYYLVQNRTALQTRANFYVRLLANIQAIPQDFAKLVESSPLSFSTHPPRHPPSPYAERKAINEIRSKMISLLGVPGLYELDRLHLDVESSIYPDLQHSIVHLFEKLHDPQFIDASGLRGKHLLNEADPSKIIYGMILYEKTPRGNLLRVVTDNLNAPFDINTGMKMQLGSTAKLRTLVNYLSIAASLYDQLSALDASSLNQELKTARDPITRWAIESMNTDPKPDLDAFLQSALDRKYSASPGESFFTGGGLHNFGNFDKSDNSRFLTVREATRRSVNLIYIRLMRDLVRYYEAHLPYDTDAILSDIENPIRQKMLREIAEEESRIFLLQTYRAFQKRHPEAIVEELLGNKVNEVRHQTILFYAWHPNADEQELKQWLEKYLGTGAVTSEHIRRLIKAYSNPRLNLSDYGYLLGIHPLKLWGAMELTRNPQLKWEQLWDQSSEARQISETWLFETRNRSAQETRLRIRFEQDAFALITPQWKKLGFPFDRLVPSLATTLGSSGDRPESLAQLMGILINDGMLKPAIRMVKLRFASKTPYETVFEPIGSEGTRVIPQAVARAILPVLAKVVESGTAMRLSGALKANDRALIVGGKTGSGDNRFDSVGSHGEIIASRPVDRTAVFVFYIEDRYFGVITVFVPGKEAGNYEFTSSLPVAILKILAPNMETLWSQSQ
jgi:membrane peptidoglycan carboxypeptidase